MYIDISNLMNIHLECVGLHCGARGVCVQYNNAISCYLLNIGQSNII